MSHALAGYESAHVKSHRLPVVNGRQTKRTQARSVPLKLEFLSRCPQLHQQDKQQQPKMRLLNFVVLLSFVFAAFALVDEGFTRQQHLDTVAQAKVSLETLILE